MSPLWPFPTKDVAAQSRRIDQGWDLQYSGKIPVPVLAVESGTLSNAGPDPNGFGPGYPVLTLDKPAPGGPAVYYGHTFTNKLLVGKHVPKGTPVGLTGGPSSGGNASNLSNWLEIGFWSNGPVGNGAEMQSWLTGATASGKGTWYVVLKSVSSRLGVDTKVVEQAPIPAGDSILAGPFQTKQEATQALTGQIVQHGKFPISIPNPLSGIDAIGHFFSTISARDFVVRLAEVLIGASLILITVAHLAENTKTGKAIIGAASKAPIP
jgi:hypothetical protein